MQIQGSIAKKSKLKKSRPKKAKPASGKLFVPPCFNEAVKPN